MRIYGAVSGYNEEQMVERCLKSLRSQVDVLVYVDGAYQKFPHDKPYSTDNSIEIAYSYCDTMVTVDKPWVDEVNKRNVYLLADPGDLYIVLDCDEELNGVVWESIKEARKSKPGAQDFKIDFHRKVHPIMSLCSRVFFHRRGIHYYGAHNALFVGNALLNQIDQPVLKADCYVEHYTDDKPQHREDTKREYYRRLRDHEREFRQENRV